MKTYWVFSFSLLLQTLWINAALAVPDPMAPPDYGVGIRGKVAPAAKPAWVVNQILVSPGRRVAVINGQAMQEGETWQGLTLLRIHAENETVVVQEKGRQRELSLPAPAVSVRQ